MKALLFLLLFLPSQAENLYGSYWFGEKSVMLNLSAPDRYNLFSMKRDGRTGMVTSKELSRGTYTLAADTLRLSEAVTGSTMTLRVASAEKLEAMKVTALKKGDPLLCQVGYYENGNPKFEGSWRKGKKHGIWVYYDSDGNIEKRVEYKRGKVAKSGQ